MSTTEEHVTAEDNNNVFSYWQTTNFPTAKHIFFATSRLSMV